MPDDPKEKEPQEDQSTLVHKMQEGEFLTIGDNVEVHLKESRNNRSILRIKAPRTLAIKLKSKKSE